MSHCLNSSSRHDDGDGDQISSASSSSAPSLGQRYEVFLTFRGETHCEFIHHLYKRLVNEGICVFRDMGEKNEKELLEAIKVSKISIPVISPDFISSEWCLNQLVQILLSQKTSGQHVIPIFYGVTPANVRKQLDDSKMDSQVCKKRKHDFDDATIQEWKDVLVEVSYLTGLQLEKTTDGYEAILVERIVDVVLEKLKVATLVTSDDLVGVDDRMAEIMNMINRFNSNNIITILLHGMGGIGKTTLAEVVFNRLVHRFKYCSYLSNVRETSRDYKGMEALQKQLISNILVQNWPDDIHSVDEGIRVIRERLSGKKVLILLDDVDSKDQVYALVGRGDWFGRGSILIITSRKQDVVIDWQSTLSFALSELNFNQSFQLFCKHAFRGIDPIPNEYDTIAKAIVSTTGGLPLAIEVIGTLLYGKAVDFWHDTLMKLRSIPHIKVQERLKISFDALTREEKEIFLDIACLPIHEEMQLAFYMWDSCGFHSAIATEHLISMSLVKVGEEGKLFMHDQLRDLGRQIVREESIDNRGRRSRLWNREEGRDVLELVQGTSQVQALILESPRGDQIIDYTSQQFKGMTRLRYLQMKNVHLKGDFENLFANLRWLRWGIYGAEIDIMGTNFNPKKLVILDLSSSNITEYWKGWNQIKFLQVLKLKSCQLATTPAFFAMTHLKVLTLIGCWSLREIHPSIHELRKTLKVLDVRYCVNLEELPIEVGTMEELKELFLDGTSIREIPIFEGYMRKLETLSAWNCKKLVSIPDSLGSLVMLKNLRLYGCDLLTVIPNSIGNLHSLAHLDLSWTGVTQLPDSIGDLANLESLYLSGTPIKCLPTSIRRLSNLQKLYLDDSEKLSNVQGIEKLMSLTHLAVTACHLEFEFPDLSLLRHLNYLEIEVEGPSEIPGLQDLMSLTELIISGCKSLQYLPDFSQFINLKVLVVEQCERLQEIRGLENLTSLQRLNIRGCLALIKVRIKNLMERLHGRLESLGIKISAMGGDCMLVNDIGDIFIPIISEIFVSDAACLSMLDHMVKRRRESANTRILPIFFEVKPSDESLQTPLFKEALSEFHKTYEEKLVIRLNDGFYTSEEIDNQANSVCQMVLQKLKWIQLSMGNHLVGIDHHVDRILNLLNLEVNDVQAVWIRGQDGVGKTTLARAVYRHLCSGFEASCFIEEIDERARHDGGIRFLQAKMVSDLLNREMEVMEYEIEGKNLISERFCHMKVLIVLDDVTGHFHIEALAGHLYWFGPGSRIIITAREEFSMEVTPPVPSYEMSFHLTAELFSVQAFRRTRPPEDFDSLLWEFVKILDPYRGLPLSIEILGSFLHGKGVEEWTSELQILKEGYSQNYVDTEKIISMSYDSLSEMQKQIFLDISCFPHGIHSRFLSSSCPGSLESPLVDDFEVLILLSLVKIDDNKGIWMHRLVRDFGRKIVDSIDRQGEQQGIEDVEGLDKSSELTPPDIKFLKLYEGKVYRDFDKVLARRRGLKWRRCSSERRLSENLVVLDFSWCKNWTGCRQIKGSKLRVLNLSGCTGLLKTPDFSLCKNLEMLILEHCSRLVKIDPSIQHLRHLATLNLKHCTELNVLPNEVGCLEALKELHLDGTSIQEIPISIGNLKNLQILTATSCSSLDHLPQTTCDLLSLTELKLDSTNVTELPCSIWERMKLQRLSLRECRGIKSLPPFDGDVESSLKELDVSRTGICELPSSIVKLKNLRVLKVDFSFISGFPPDFGNLKNLEEIHASWCRNLENLPEDIEKLESLKVFKVGHSTVSSIPKGIHLLRSLETLDCTSCDKLQSLPEFPSSLTTLHVQLTELKTLPDLVNLKRLREFTLESSSLRILGLNLPQIRDLPTLPDSLRKLSLRCAKLKYMPRLPSKLVVLSLQGCHSLTKLPTMKPLQNLLEMEILHCPNIKKIEGLGGLKALRSLKISDCRVKSLEELDKLTSLTKLTLQDCRLLGNLCVKSLQNLMEMEILGCPEIEKMEGLEGLRKLRRVTILV